MSIASAANIAKNIHTPQTAGDITVEQAKQADRQLRESNTVPQAWETGHPYTRGMVSRLGDYLTSAEPHEPIHITRRPVYEAECSCGAKFTTPEAWGEHYAAILLDAAYGIND